MAFGGLRGTLSSVGASILASNVITGSVAVSVGDLVVLGAGEFGVTATASAVTDNLGNTYANIVPRLWYARVATAGTLTTLTVAATASGNDFSYAVAVFEGPFTAPPLDRAPAGLNDTTSPFVGPATGVLSQADELVVCVLNLRVGQTDTLAVTPNILAINVASGADAAANTCSTALGYQVVSSTTSVTPQFTAVGTITAGFMVTGSFKKDTGPFIVDGDLVLTQAAQTISALAGSRVDGALSAAEANDTLAAAGTVVSPGITGTLALTQAPQTLAATGTPAVRGTLTATEVPDTITAAGGPRIGGTLAATQTAQVLVAAGSLVVGATLNRTEVDDTISAAGMVVFPPVTGTLNRAQATQTLAATGNLRVDSTLTVVQSAQTLVATGIITMAVWTEKPVKVWLDGAWVIKPVKVWLDGAWATKVAKEYSGEEWIVR